MSFGEKVNSLEQRIHSAWESRNFCLFAFPEIARTELERAIAGGELNGAAVVDWLSRSPPLPFQPRLDQTFGQPPLTLAWNGLFQIDALFWRAAGTAIHAHGFAGAFAVGEGASLHFTYRFTETDRVSEHFRFGAVERTRFERLEVGAVRPIEPAPDRMHALIHLGRPSVSFVVRTCDNAPGVTELVGFPPAVALAPLPDQPLRRRQIQVLEMLAEVDPQRALAMAGELLSRCDLHTAFLAITGLGARPGTAAAVEALQESVIERHGSLARTMLPSIRQALVQRKAEALFRSVGDEGARSLVAMLLYCPSRRELLECIAAAHPGEEPGKLAGRWLVRLAGLEPGRSAADAGAARLLGGWIEGAGGADRPNGAALASLDEEDRAAVVQLCEDIRSQPLFAPLFGDGGGERVRESEVHAK